jgi:hypothetical protein
LEHSVFSGKCSKMVEFMDVDQDGFIDVNDFEIFLKRFNYIEDNIKERAGRTASLPSSKKNSSKKKEIFYVFLIIF